MRDRLCRLDRAGSTGWLGALPQGLPEPPDLDHGNRTSRHRALTWLLALTIALASFGHASHSHAKADARDSADGVELGVRAEL